MIFFHTSPTTIQVSSHDTGSPPYTPGLDMQIKPNFIPLKGLLPLISHSFSLLYQATQTKNLVHEFSFPTVTHSQSFVTLSLTLRRFYSHSFLFSTLNLTSTFFTPQMHMYRQMDRQITEKW